MLLDEDGEQSGDIDNDGAGRGSDHPSNGRRFDNNRGGHNNVDNVDHAGVARQVGLVPRTRTRSIAQRHLRRGYR